MNLASKRRGFTLMELAIVLLVASLILGAIWAAAQSAWEGYRVYRTTQQIARVVQNIRETYMAAANLTASMAVMDQSNIFPFEMRRNPNAVPADGVIDNPFNNTIAGGSFVVAGNVFAPAGAPANFRIRLLGLGSGACVKMLLEAPVSDATFGIVRVGTTTGALTGAVQGVDPPPALVASQARGWCNQAGNNNEVDWDFKLRN